MALGPHVDPRTYSLGRGLTSLEGQRELVPWDMSPGGQAQPHTGLGGQSLCCVLVLVILPADHWLSGSTGTMSLPCL